MAHDGGAERRVVVGVDASPAARAALAVAYGEARRRGATLHVVHAWHVPPDVAVSPTSGVVPPVDDLRHWADEVLDEALGRLGPLEVPVVRQVTDGPAAAVLEQAARGAELLVVGTRGHGRLTGMFLGSVSQHVTAHASCPVLVIHAPPADARSGTTGRETEGPGAPPMAVLEEIPEAQCLALLATRDVGRLAVVREGAPLVLPVNYVLDGHTVAVRTDPGTKLDQASLGHVALEVDDVDPATHEGWSVLVRGVGRDVTDGVDAWSTRVRALTLQPWVEGDKAHWIALASPEVTGRRLRPAAVVAGEFAPGTGTGARTAR